MSKIVKYYKFIRYVQTRSFNNVLINKKHREQ